MARYLLRQYLNKNSAHQRDGKRGDKKNGGDPKSEDKDSNTGCTIGKDEGDTTPPEVSTTPCGGASIITYVLETNKQSSSPSRTVEEILGIHPISDDDFWGGTNPGDVSIDTAKSKDVMGAGHITEQHTYEYQGPISLRLLNMVLNNQQTYDLLHNYQFYSPNKFKDLNILLKTNKVIYTTGADL